MAAWADLWTGGFEISGRDDIATAANTSLYYLLSSARDDLVSAESLSPGTLASDDYSGHTFWDCETWMFPSLALWVPDIAHDLLRYRFERLAAARDKAASYDPPYSGSMFPWESSQSGVEVRRWM